MKLVVAAVLLAAACSSGSKDGSCAERTATLAKRLAAPRPPDEIRKTAPPALLADLDGVPTDDPSRIATYFAERLEAAVGTCAPLVKVFGDVATVEGPGGKDDFLRAEVPKAIEACGCAASPEHAGGLVEAILTDWARSAGTP